MKNFSFLFEHLSNQSQASVTTLAFKLLIADIPYRPKLLAVSRSLRSWIHSGLRPWPRVARSMTACRARLILRTQHKDESADWKMAAGGGGMARHACGRDG